MTVLFCGTVWWIVVLLNKETSWIVVLFNKETSWIVVLLNKATSTSIRIFFRGCVFPCIFVENDKFSPRVENHAITVNRWKLCFAVVTFEDRFHAFYRFQQISRTRESADTTSRHQFRLHVIDVIL